MNLAAKTEGWSRRETIFFIWVGLALASLYPVAVLLDASFPVLTLIWLVVPLLAVLRGWDAARVGFRAVALRQLLPAAATNLGLLMLVLALFEPWSDAYGTLVREAVMGDVTFAWLVRVDSPTGWLAMFAFSSLVTIFAEELFFRGWLLQGLLRRLGHWRAILLQALLFALPQAIPAFFLNPAQAVVWIVVYAFLGVGLINGWSAARTGSIWPGVIAAPIMNVLVAALVL